MQLTPASRCVRPALAIRVAATTARASCIVTILLAAGVAARHGALTVDVGLTHAERRELQNGAEAAALAVAGRLRRPRHVRTAASSLAGSFADLNAADTATR